MAKKSNWFDCARGPFNLGSQLQRLLTAMLQKPAVQEQAETWSMFRSKGR